MERFRALLHQAPDAGCEVVVYSEPTLTTFLLGHHSEDRDEIDAMFKREMPSPDTEAALRRGGAPRRRIRSKLGSRDLFVWGWAPETRPSNVSNATPIRASKGVSSARRPTPGIPRPRRLAALTTSTNSRSRTETV